MKHDPATFAAYDAQVADLPPELPAARDAVRRLTALRERLGVATVGDAQHLDTYAGRLAATALETEPDVAGIAAHIRVWRDSEADAATERDVVSLAIEIAEDRLNLHLRDYAQIAVRDYLAPTQDKVLDAVRAARATYAKHGSTPHELLTAPAKAREAWAAVDDLVRQYQLIRRTRGALLKPLFIDLGGDFPDYRHYFAETRNTEVIWPPIVGRLSQPPQPPWATEKDPRARLLMLLDADAVIWCPIIAEQHQRWLEVFGEGTGYPATNRRQLVAFRGAMAD